MLMEELMNTNKFSVVLQFKQQTWGCYWLHGENGTTKDITALHIKSPRKPRNKHFLLREMAFTTKTGQQNIIRYITLTMSFIKKKQAQHLTGQYLNLPRPAHTHRLLASCHTKSKETGQNGNLSAGHLIVFPVSLLSEEPGLLQLVLQGLHPLLVREGSVLQDLPHTEIESLLESCSLRPSLKKVIAQAMLKVPRSFSMKQSQCSSLALLRPSSY